MPAADPLHSKRAEPAPWSPKVCCKGLGNLAFEAGDQGSLVCRSGEEGFCGEMCRRPVGVPSSWLGWWRMEGLTRDSDGRVNARDYYVSGRAYFEEMGVHNRGETEFV